MQRLVQSPSDILNDKEALDLVRSYYAIPEEQRPPFVRFGAGPKRRRLMALG